MTWGGDDVIYSGDETGFVSVTFAPSSKVIPFEHIFFVSFTIQSRNFKSLSFPVRFYDSTECADPKLERCGCPDGLPLGPDLCLNGEERFAVRH